MITLIAYGNINKHFPFESISKDLVPLNLQQLPIIINERTLRRHKSRKLAHFLLWELCKTAKIDTALLTKITRTQSGRPQFPVHHIDFNISHSGDWVAVELVVESVENVAVAGIDIESPRKERDYTALLAHFAPEQEQLWLAQQENPKSAFYRCWCLREALLKTQGVGIVKLSEVRHFPDKQLAFSDYCPQGELIFTKEFGFYLAAFLHNTEQIRFFEWKDHSLMQVIPQKTIQYQINPK